jgi:hypothetical protein
VGFAAGFEGTSRSWRYEASVGRSDPGAGVAGWTAAVEVQRNLDPSTRLSGYLSRGVRVRLLPRMSDDLDVTVGQALAYPVVSRHPPNETLWQAELGAARAGKTRRGAVTVRAVRIENAAIAEDGLELFDPAVYLGNAFPDSALGQEIRSLSLRLELAQDPRWGFSCTGTGWLRTSHPGWRDQLWGTPAEARGDLSWRSWLFQEDFRVHAFVRGVWSSSRATPYGTVAPQARLDGGATAGVGPFRVYWLFLNLVSTEDPASTYVVDFIAQPLRSFRMGLTWRFLD